jgi:hypothetical protein
MIYYVFELNINNIDIMSSCILQINVLDTSVY